MHKRIIKEVFKLSNRSIKIYEDDKIILYGFDENDLTYVYHKKTKSYLPWRVFKEYIEKILNTDNRA